MGSRRILVIGGAGHFGRAVCEAVAKLPAVTVVAGGRSGPGVVVDLNKPATFEVLREFDLIVNAADSLRAPPDQAMRFALANGLTWLEMSADPALMARVQDFDTPLASGSVLLGAGLFPGLSTALARETAARCATASSLDVAIRLSPLSGAGRGSCALMTHTLSQESVRYHNGIREMGPVVGPVAEIAFGDGDVQAAAEMALPDADLLHHTVRAANIRTRLALVPRPALVAFRALAWLSGALGAMRAPFLSASYRLLFLLRAVLLRRTSSRVDLTATAEDIEGERHTLRVTVPDGRVATALATAAFVQSVLAAPVPTGIRVAARHVSFSELVGRMNALGGEMVVHATTGARPSRSPRAPAVRAA